jgi:hypothetical protein
MQLTLEQIQEEMQDGGLSPRRVSDFRVYLAAVYALRSVELEAILLVKPDIWLKMRNDKNSDTATDRAWDASANGKRETQLKMELKRIEKLSSALASHLRVMEGEARTQY